jgi:hypothetical protein
MILRKENILCYNAEDLPANLARNYSSPLSDVRLAKAQV